MSLHADHRPLIWITDDSAVEAGITERALGTQYRYEYFADGSLVLERLAGGGRQPDVLLLDWVMPGVSGDEVCRFLRGQPQTADLPIILVTASRIETSDIVQGLTFGANDYVARPFVPEELRARVESVLRAKRLRETAMRERNRLAVINKLGRAFVDVGPRVERVFELLASTLVDGLCDGCALTILPGVTPAMTVARRRDGRDEALLAGFAATDPCAYTFTSKAEAKLRLPAAYHPAVDQFGMSAFAVIPFPARSPIAGVITVMRDEGAPPFEQEDMVTFETCLEYAAMAFGKALRFDAEQGMRRQLETILEQMPVSVIVADPTGAILHINQTALALSPHLRSAHNVHDVRKLLELRLPEGSEVVAGDFPLDRAIRGETVRGIELEIADGDGKRFLRASAVPMRDSSGSVVAAILAFEDVTAEHNAATEREAAVEFQRYILGIVSHDLRSPLQTLLMGCEGIKLQAQAIDHQKIVQFVGRMESTTHRMRGIIEQLLDVVRTQLGGGIPVTPAEVDLGEVVTGVLGELALAYPNAQFEPKLAHVRGNWDRDRLAQVVSNLVGNALQHGAKQSPIWIVTERAGNEALLRVTNRAVTELTTEQKERIFAPFRRTKRATGGSGGLGLGLYIASEILRAHDGAISVESNADMTTFTVRLPLVQANAQTT